eukprot:3465479-Pleurochrysis_carterae.AAC.1
MPSDASAAFCQPPRLGSRRRRQRTSAAIPKVEKNPAITASPTTLSAEMAPSKSVAGGAGGTGLGGNCGGGG